MLDVHYTLIVGVHDGSLSKIGMHQSRHILCPTPDERGFNFKDLYAHLYKSLPILEVQPHQVISQ